MIWKKVWAAGLTLSMLFTNAVPTYALETTRELSKTESLARTDFSLTDLETGEEGEDFSETAVEEEPGSEEEELPAETDPAETPGEGEETVTEPGTGEESAPEVQPAEEEPAPEAQPAEEEIQPAEEAEEEAETFDDSAEPVAQIGSEQYTTLEAAFAAAQDGDTITLIDDAAGNGIIAKQGAFGATGLTVDFKGHTYTVDGDTVGSTGTETNGFQLLRDNKITFKNGTIYSEKAQILIQNYSNLTLEKMNLTLNNSNYGGLYTLSNNNGDIVIDGTTINANPAGGFAFDVCRYASYPSVHVTVKGESVINGNVELSASGSNAKEGFSLRLESGSITGNIVVDSTARAAMEAAPEKVSVTKADTFAQEAPEGFKWNNEGKLEAVYVAQIGDKQYGTLEAAFAAAKDGDTITLIDDAAGNGIIAKQGAFGATGLTVDFKGHTYTVDGDTVGSTGTETNGFQLLRDNKITFMNGTITSAKAKILIQNYSNLTLEGMTLTLNNPDYPYAYTLSNNNGDIVIDGTTINANPAGGFAFDVCRYASYPSVHVTVKGESVINGNVELSASGSNAKEGFSLRLESGSITGNIVVDSTARAAMEAAPEKVSVTKTPKFETSAPEGYLWNEDGQLVEAVAQIGSEQYTTLEAAFAAAQDGDTITLIADAAGNGIVAPQGKFTEGLTVDFNGHTYTVDGETVGSAGTETNGFQLLRDNKITFMNGTITSAKAKILIQNYSNLTLEGMTLTLNNPDYPYAYTLSNNNGDIVIDGTTINANPAGGFAFDVCRFSSYPSVHVTVKGESVINGNVELSASGSDAKEGFSLRLESGSITGNIVVDSTARAAMEAAPELVSVTKADTFAQEAPEGFKWNTEGQLIEIIYVAQIDEVKYETLEAAFAAAKDGDTITLIADASGNGIKAPQGKFTAGLTVDFKEHTYTMDGEMVGSTGTETQAFQLLKDNKITFMNGTITSAKAKILIQNYSNLTLEGMTLTLNNLDYPYAYTLSNNNGDIVIDGTTINANPAGGFAFDVCRFSSYPSVHVTVKGESVINGNVELSASGSDAKEGFGLTLESGTMTGQIVVTTSAAEAMDSDPSSVLIKKAESFVKDAPEGYFWDEDDDEDGAEVLKLIVAKIGETPYASISDAIAEASEGDTVRLVRGEGEDGYPGEVFADEVPENAKVILDLDGRVFNGGIRIDENAELTVKNGSANGFEVSGNAKLIVENDVTTFGTVSASDNAIVDFYGRTDAGVDATQNGTPTINIYDGADIGGAGVSVYHGAILNVSGGKITEIFTPGSPSINISGGEIETVNIAGTGEPTKLTITDGKIETLNIDASAEACEAKITGGEFGKIESGEVKGFISGGIFKERPAEDLLAENHMFYETFGEDGAILYVVADKDAAEVEKQIGELSGKDVLAIADQIEAARKAFDALTPEEQALVKNLDKLEKAEQALKRVRDAVEAIDKIVSPITLDDENDVRNAREVFDDLQEGEEAFVENRSVLFEAESKITQLKSLEDILNEDGIQLDHEYIILDRGDSLQLRIVDSEQLGDVDITWSVENNVNGEFAADAAPIIRVEDGLVTAGNEAGTAYAVVTVSLGAGVEFTARCRVDVIEDDIRDDLKNYGVRLIDTKVKTDLLSTDYTPIRIQLSLFQNMTAHTMNSDPNSGSDGESAETVAKIQSAEFENRFASNIFELKVRDDRTLEIVPKSEYVTTDKAKLKDVKGSYKTKVNVVIDGKPYTSDQTLTLTVNKKLPKISASAVKLNSFIEDEKAIVIKGGTLEHIDSFENDWVKIDGDGTVRYKLGENRKLKKSAKVSLSVQLKGWAVPNTLKISVSAAPILPKMTFKPATLTLKPNTIDSASTAWTITPAIYAEDDVKITRIAEGKTSLSNMDDPHSFKYGENGIVADIVDDRLVVSAYENFDDSKARTFKVYLDVDGVEKAVTVKTLKKSAAVTLALKASGGINLKVPESPVIITATPKNFSNKAVMDYAISITDAAGADANGRFEIDPKDNVFTLTAGDGLAAGTYTVTVKASGENGGNPASPEATVKITVKDQAVKQSVSLKSKGMIDVLRPGTEVALTPMFKNCYDYEFAGIVVTNKKKEVVTGLFEAREEDGKILVSAADDKTVTHADTYTVKALYKINGTDQPIESKAVKLNVKQGNASVAIDKKTADVFKFDRFSTAEVTIALTDDTLEGIDRVEFVSPKVKGIEAFTMRELENGKYVIAFNENLLPVNAKYKGGKVKFQVFLKGNETAKPNKTFTVKVNVK